MIEQRRRATQERIQAHLNGLDKSKVQQEKKEVKSDLSEEENKKTCDKQQEKECTVEKIEQKTSGPQDPVPAEKEAELADTNLPNQTKEPTSEKEEKKVTKVPTQED